MPSTSEFTKVVNHYRRRRQLIIVMTLLSALGHSYAPLAEGIIR
jgi:hypothetical protein